MLISCGQKMDHKAETTITPSFKKVIPAFEITLESDSLCNGTRYRTTLTNAFFEDRYLKGNGIPNDTIIQFQDNIPKTEELYKLATYDYSKISSAKSVTTCGSLCTMKRNGKSTTVQLDRENPDPFICLLVSYLNELSVEKYRNTICE